LENDVFARLLKPIRRIVGEKGFSSPTGPQNQAIPLILEKKNVLLIAPTGTGKTEAAFLPVFSQFLRLVNRPRGIKILYITPLRSLNRDILQRLTWWCGKLDINVAVRHGDTSSRARTIQSRDPPDMLITTPETLQAILPGRRLRKHLAAVRWVIIDEVHEFAEDKRGSQLSLALERLRLLAEQEFQVIGLSATIGSPEKVAKFLVGTGRSVEIVKVPVAREMEFQIIYPSPSVEDDELASQLYTHPEVAARLRVMREIIEKNQSVLLFTNTRSIAEILASRFKVWDLDFPVSIHHGSLAKPARIAAETGLKGGELRGLVCTSSLELGIDVGKIDMCIQYMSPRQVTRLVQRIGRSGHRIGRTARGIIITMDADDTFEAMVIARKAYLEDLEPVGIPEKPLDTLSHQIVGLLMLSRKWEFDGMLEIFTKAYPYRGLDKKQLSAVLTYMHTRYPRFTWVSFEDELAMRPRSIKAMYQFYYDNLSMIPDRKSYLVVNEEKETPVGILDEAFVAEYGKPGTKFIVRGSPWRIISVYGDKIFVKPSDDPTGAIPSWIGEEIPVPFTIAQEVGEIRDFIETNLIQGIEPKLVAKALANRYPAGQTTIFHAMHEIVAQFEKGIPIPTHKKIVIEGLKEHVILHLCIGNLANRTLSTLLGHLLADKIGYSIGTQVDSYRIVFQSIDVVNSAIVKDLLYELSTMDLDEFAQVAFKATGLFKRRMIQVARKFGAVSKQADFGNISLHQLTKSFQGTAIFDEAVKTTLDKDANLDGVKQILKKIQIGEIEIALIQLEEPSPIARISFDEIGRRTSLISPERLQNLTLESAKVRLFNEVRTFVCTDCWDFIDTLPIKKLEEKLVCPNCSSARIGILNMSAQEIQPLRNKRGKNLTSKEKEIATYAKQTATLMKKHGKRSALVLAGKNLRLSDAEEILFKTERISDKLFTLVIEVEKKALARRFW
jgi:ATP-dependent Lhr-like helicase